ncbi:MAG: 2-dehydropantoate 2-reductase [Syntrophales bacterium]|nr:2-dehydropantoate 2-reductase [Syntrophales bacterium]
MRIAVIGLGGVGGYFGGKLVRRFANAGEHRIVFFARGKHLEAIRRDGLKIISTEGNFTARPWLATDRSSEAGPLDIILFCVKGYDLEEAARSIAGCLHDSTVILPLLNGVDISERIENIVPEGIVLRGTAYISSRIVSPGVIERRGDVSRIVFGPGGKTDPEEFRYIETIFRQAGVDAALQGNMADVLWAKYGFIEPLATLSAFTGKNFGELLADGETLEKLRGLTAELDQVARKQGIRFPGDLVSSVLEKAGSFPPETKTSLQLDFENKRRTELEIFTGYIVKKGKELGISVPIHDEIYEKLKK